MANSVDQKMLRQTKFPAEFNQKVDMQKVNIEVMKKWIAGKISEILGSEDDVVIELCFNLLEGSRFPSIKVLQIQLTGFLEKDTAAFCKELWTLCLSAQSNPQGVPKELLEAKKLELIQEKIAAEKAAETTRRRQEQERAREREMEHLRRRDRPGHGERGRGRGSDAVTTRGLRDFESRAQRNSRTPPPRPRNSSDYRFLPPRREVDTYIPSSNSHGQQRRRRRSRSPSNSPSRSVSRSPPRRRQRRSRSRSLSRSATPKKHRSQFSRGPSEERLNQGGYSRDRRRVSRGKDRGRPGSIEKSRSRSPRTSRREKRSTSVSSQSSTPSDRDRHGRSQLHATTRRQSKSLSPRSPTRGGHRSGTHEETRQSVKEVLRDTDALAETDYDHSKARLRQRDRQRESSQSSSRSTERHVKRRR